MEANANYNFSPSIIKPIPELPVKNSKFKEFLKKNKNILLGGFVVFFGVALVGVIFKIKASSFMPFPTPQVEGDLTQASPIGTPFPISTSTPIPTDTPTNIPTYAPVDSSSEGAIATNTPVPTATPSPTPTATPTSTPTPAPYIVSFSSIAPNPALADGSPVTVTINVQGGSGGGGETVNLSADSRNVSVNPGQINANGGGNAVFTISSTTAGTYNLTANVWGTTASSSVTFNAPTPTP